MMKMNPLSPFTYYRRHKRGALLQIALIGLATLGLYILVAVLDTIPMRANVSYLTRLSRVAPTGGALDPALVSQIQAHPDVARVIPDNGLMITMPALFGTDSLHLMGVSTQDAEYLMGQCGVRLKAGRMLEPRTNEFLLSEEVARALDLQLGDEIGRKIDQNYYETVPTILVLVGILENDPAVKPGPGVRLGFVSAEYLNNHELYAPRSTSLLVVARDGRNAAMEEFLETTIQSKYTQVETFALLTRFFRLARIGVYVIFGVINSVVAVVMAFAVGIINRIAITKRLSEFGLLHALGRQKTRLVRRLTLETASVAGAGCLAGLAIALLVLIRLKNGFFYELGIEVYMFNLAPFFFVLPIPLIVVALTFLSVRRIFARLDAVDIVERGELSEEQKKRRAVKDSSARPLSSLTFYRRHRRRGVLMVFGTALMVLAITFPVFLFSAMTSALLPTIDYLQYVSEVLPVHAELDPGVVGQIRSHPAVARTVPVVRLGVQMVLPPGGGGDVNIYGVSEADLPVLLELFGVGIQEGHLPRPYSNEVVLSAAIAANRDLQVGEVIGGDVDSGEILVWDHLPTEMVIVGILSPDRPWIGFASYEYLRSHELTASWGARLFIVPHEGQKQALDSWLSNTDERHSGLDATQTRVRTYASEEKEYREMTISTVVAFGALELMIAVVAAVALATLNYIFFSQRTEEFGILNAVGRSRPWLVWRVIKETGGLLVIAWGAGALLCGIGLLIMQNLVYAPRGLSLDFFSLAPWLLTLPLPVAVLLASTGTIVWTLRRLDPVMVIEMG
jgi:ABC-type antimicrobial peptide transport system permease subunit